MVGKFIVFEGPDGSGKSTQFNLLCDRLEKKELKVVRTKEPTNGSIGKEIRKAARGEIQLTPEEFTNMFYEDRKNHNENLINPSLEKGKFVISDRYYHSTICYQTTEGMPLEDVMKIHKKYNPRTPDTTIVVNVPGKVAIERIDKRGEVKDIFEKREFLEKLCEKYSTLNLDENIIIVDGIGTIEEIHERIWTEIKKLL